jgi:murein DD-endopeptidase / murein LD-carboxypeptidase
MQKWLIALVLVALSFRAFATDELTCAIEELACEEQVSYEDVIGFLHKLSLNPMQIKQPDLYVTTFSWLNTPYRYGGNSRNGIDCSRFAMMLQQKKISITSSGGSADLFKLGNPIEKEELQEGDLVFFRIRNGRISHVGVYLQEGKFAHSSTSKGVIISNLEEPYWKKYFYKGTRISSSTEQTDY